MSKLLVLKNAPGSNVPYYIGRLFDLLDLQVEVLLISKLSSEIITRSFHELRFNPHASIDQLRNIIYDISPALYLSGDYKIFWRYSKSIFLEIYDEITIEAFLKCNATFAIYVLLSDYDEFWDDNFSFLLDLDKVEEQEREERERDLYNFPPVKEQTEEIATDLVEEVFKVTSKIQRQIRTESEILAYALRNERPNLCYTMDNFFGKRLIADMQPGYPNQKFTLQIQPDVQFEKRGPKGKKEKEKKGKKGKKDKNVKKGKKAKGKKKK